MQQQIQKKIEILQLQKADKENTIKELYSDPSIIPAQEERLSQNDKRCPNVCGRFDGGNRSCRHQ